jgi:deoxyribodipyrimidine photo-lyase
MNENISNNKKSKKLKNGLFIFRRDFRIVDNNGLNHLADLCENIYTIFIFTPEQVGSKNKFKSNCSVQFMIESLSNLESEIKKKNGILYTFYGDNNKIITNCIKEFEIDMIGFNMDITPYAKNRDNEIIKLCKNKNIGIIIDHDYYLQPVETVKTQSNEIYKKFTPFYNTAIKFKVNIPIKNKKINFKSKNTNISNRITLDHAIKTFTIINKNIKVHGGRIEALKLLKIAKEMQNKYNKTRNDLIIETSLLSASIKFGCISIREVYYEFKNNKDFLKQLYWRDFYANILYKYPYVLGKEMKINYQKLKWKKNEIWFEKWCDGKTGFPIVDAGMRQMNITGYMHNRARLIVASFLIKLMLIDWKKGEKYFAQKLTDFDPASNNLNFQWCASTGVDSQPYFRIFNPWRQTISYDPECKYIKKWIPELKDVPINDILDWENKWIKYKNIKYSKPIFDYNIQKEKALEMYKKVYE